MAGGVGIKESSRCLFEFSEEEKKIVGSFNPEDRKRAEEIVEKYNSKLRRNAKKQEELLSSVDFIVNSVVGRVYQSQYVTDSIMMGGKSLGHKTGDISLLELKVCSSDTPIKELAFPGLPPIQAGDTICAYIFRGQSMQELDSYGHANGASCFVKRPFEEKEIPLKIEKLKEGKVIATYINEYLSPSHF
jgi:hypothetical protein